MAVVGSILSFIGGIIGLVCFIIVLIKMFQNGQTGLGIACIVLFFCCGIGYLIAFIYGWVKSSEWNIRNTMLIWTVGLVVNIAGTAMNPPNFQQIQQMQPQ